MELYIDPGTGSMLFAILIGIVGAANFAFRSAWVKLKFLLSGGKAKADEGQECPAYAIFSDDKRYWNIFEPICREMDARGIDVDYLTASEDDAALSCELPRVHARFIGAGNAAFAKLNTMRAHVMLSTTPGLDVYQWKRSPEIDHYVHIFHSVGEAQLYRMFGIDFYDAVLASGPAQVRGVRELEELRGLQPKEISVVGAPYMDAMAERLEKSLAFQPEKACWGGVFTSEDTREGAGEIAPSHEGAPEPESQSARALEPESRSARRLEPESECAPDPEPAQVTVLLAPSWGDAAIFGKYGDRMIKDLLATGYHVIVRPHPQSFKSETELIEGLMERFPNSDQLEWNRDVDNFEVLRRADILISDFSGIIFEFALVYDKPVIYASASIDKDPYDAWWVPGETWTEQALPSVGLELDAAMQKGGIKAAIDACLSDLQIANARQALREEAWCQRGNGAKMVVDYLVAAHDSIMDARALEGSGVAK